MRAATRARVHYVVVPSIMVVELYTVLGEAFHEGRDEGKLWKELLGFVGGGESWLI